MTTNGQVFHFKHWPVVARPGYYDNGRKAIQLVHAEDGSPVAKATVNIPDAPLEEDEVHIKTWSENEGMTKAMVEAGYIDEPYDHASSGFAIADRCRLTENGRALFA